MLQVHYCVVAYLILQRVVELRLSRRNQASMIRQKFVRSGEGGEYVYMVATHLAWFVGLMLEPLILPRHGQPILSIVAFLVFVSAQALRFWAIHSLRQRWNVNIFVSSACDEIVRSGPYKYIRHPNYLAVILEIAFVPMIGGAYLTAVIGSALNAFVLSKRIPREERELFKNPAYREFFLEKARLLPF